MSALSSRGNIISTASADTRRLGGWRVRLQLARPAAAAKVRQVHGGSIIPVSAARPDLPADGLYVERGEAAAVTTADCLPLVLVSDMAALALHVSRKTCIYGLLENAFSYMPPKTIDRIYAGPHICEYHFSFEREELELKRFRERYPRAVHFHGGNLHVSLRAAVEHVLREWDIHPQRVVWDGRCTYEHVSLPSYRRWLDQGKPGELGQLWTMADRLPAE